MNDINKIEQAIFGYIDEPKSDFAIMIDGEWGSGKTYFWKNKIKPYIDKKKLNVQADIRDNNWISKIINQKQNSNQKVKKIKSIYISLYGLENLDDINNSIFLELGTPEFLSKLKNKFPLINKIINAGLSAGGLRYFNLSSVKDELIKLIRDNKIENANSYNDIILCFDDLERSKLDIEIVLGYINQYVEHNQIKTILICNESEINKNNKKYIKIKEKMIGFSFKYKPSLDLVIKHFIKDYSEQIQEIIRNNLELILDIVQRSKHNNLRSIKNSLYIVDKIINCYLQKKYNQRYEPRGKPQLVFRPKGRGMYPKRFIQI